MIPLRVSVVGIFLCFYRQTSTCTLPVVFPAFRHKMKTELHEVILTWVKDYVRSLSDNDFLALTCNMRLLFCELVAIIREESSRRNINPTSNTARTFDRSPRQIQRM